MPKVTVTWEFDSVADAAAGLAAVVAEATKSAAVAADVGTVETAHPVVKDPPKDPPKPEHDRAEVRQALKAMAALSGKEEAIKILKEVGGVDAMSDLPESKFDAVWKAASES